MTVQEWLGENNQLGIDIWNKKYRFENESFDEWLDRISGGVEEYKKLIQEKKFLPGGRILANRGLSKKGEKVTYSNCYVIPAPEDSIESIFDCAKAMARTFSYGGGVGIDISKLAPRGAKVNNTAKKTSGATSFMDLYSMVTGLIGQNGRRGALMISLACDHPDIQEFIDLKSDLDKVTKANISVRVTKDFMNAVINNEDFKLSFTREETGEVIEKIVKAEQIFDRVSYMNWNYAEPGILFWDRIREWNLLSNNSDFEYAGVNPCAEEPLPAGGSCLLGSINLAEFVKNEEFQWKDFIHTVHVSVDFLNDILDEGLRLHPLKIQQESVHDWRQIGLGIMGLADMLIKMRLVYGSPESLAFCDQVGKILIDSALDESCMLASEHGPYPKYNDNVLDTPFVKFNASSTILKGIELFGLRNSQLLTCAPTGTLSTMLGISGGIEPIFANYYTRRTQSLHGHDEIYKVYTPIVKQYMDSHHIQNDEDLPEWFITAPEIEPINRIKMQGIWQSHIDASISSTINLPNNCSVKDIKEIYLAAYEQGLKGITIYRAGCKREGILVKDGEETELDHNQLSWGTVIKVNNDLSGMKKKLTSGCGNFHLQVFFDEEERKIWETFISLGDGAGCERNIEFISRLMSKCLRAGVPIEEIIETAKSVRPCLSYCMRAKSKEDTSPGTSCASAIGHALEEFNGKIKKLETKKEKIEEEKVTVCPECGAPLYHEGGCDVCKECGYSHCG